MNQNKTEANKEQRPTDVASGAVLGDTARTEMKCRICGGFSSAQTCWHCSTNPGVQVLAAEVTNLRAALEEIRNMAMARKSCIRMPDGRMLDTFCRHALSPNGELSDRTPKT
jgi:hypothetical protein